MDKLHLINYFTKRDWKLSNFGHLSKEIAGKTYRLKFQAHTIRLEVDAGSIKERLWVRLQTTSNKDVIYNSDKDTYQLCSRIFK